MKKNQFFILFSRIWQKGCCLILFLLLASIICPQVRATTTGEMPVGSIAQMSGMKFVKVTSNCLFIGLEGYGGAKRVVIDYGASTSLVAPTIATGQVCSWEDSNNNLVSPHSCTTLVYPTVTTTYQLTVTYGTSSSTYLYQVVVNSPSSNPTTYTINLGNTQTLTAPTVISNQTCTWNPSTYLSSSTSCAPIATPTIAGTTTYTVTLSTGHQFSYLLVTTPTTFQTMTASYCSYMTSCTIGANCSTNGSTLTLTDTRDSKTYRIRKFADGNCWMIDNLKYGGGINGSGDYCANKTTRRDATSAANSSATNTNGLNPPTGTPTVVGDCIDSKSGSWATAYCINNDCGYYYNWPATIQNSLGYNGNNYQPIEPTQGICPSEWILPTHTGNYSFYNLYITYNSPTTENFWTNTNYWAGIYTGYLYGGQGTYGYAWTSTQSYDHTNAQCMFYNENGSWFDTNQKLIFYPIRCLYSP